MDLPSSWAELRGRVLAFHPEYRGGRSAVAATAALLARRLREAVVVETLRGPQGLRAAIGLCPEPDSWYGVPVVHWMVDVAPYDADATAWAARQLGELASRVDEHLTMTVDAANAAVLPAGLALGCHVSSLVLLGEPRACLEALGDEHGDPRVAFVPLRSDHLDEVIDVKRRYFAAHPEHGWFIAGDAYLDRERQELVTELNGTHPTRFVAVREGRVLGLVGFRLDWRNPYWGVTAGMDLTLDPALHGRGVGRAAYRMLLGRMVELGVQTLKGGTSNPAVLHLARRMRRPLLAWELRSGEAPLPAAGFDYPARW
jgi:GNAT superfamily N-acetyltransferase